MHEGKSSDTILKGHKIAILVADGFDQREFEQPLEALRKAGADTVVVSPEKGRVSGWKNNNWGDEVEVDLNVDDARADDFDGLLLPGGVKNPDTLRANENAVSFVRDFFSAGKPVAAICHAPWVLIEADVVRGRQLTSYESIKTDLKNAGAHWVDEEVVVDEGLVTSRKPADLPAFNRKMIEEFAEGVHAGQTA